MRKKIAKGVTHNGAARRSIIMSAAMFRRKERPLLKQANRDELLMRRDTKDD